jgi:negative regulator of flagellin synthesis FlgM
MHSMKIENTQVNSTALTQATAATQAEKNAPAIKLEKSGTEKDAAKGEAFDAEKVAAIKAAIAEGSFKVDVAKAADGLINATKDFLSK